MTERCTRIPLLSDTFHPKPFDCHFVHFFEIVVRPHQQLSLIHI